MPIMDGIQLMQILHNEYPGIIIIVISGYADFEYARKAIAYNAFGYVLKPVDKEEFEQVINLAVSKFKERERLDLKVSRLEERARYAEFNIGESSLGINFKSEFKNYLIAAVKLAQDGLDIDSDNWDEKSPVVFKAEDMEDSEFHMLRISSHEFLLAMGFNADEDAFLNKLEHSIAKLNQGAGQPVWTGVGEIVSSVDQLRASFLHSQEALLYAGNETYGSIVNYKSVKNHQAPVSISEDATMVQWYLEKGKGHEWSRFMDRIFWEWENSPSASLSFAKKQLQELTIKLESTAEAVSTSLLQSVFEVSRLILDPHRLFTWGELRHAFEKLSSKVMEDIKNREQSLSHNAIQEVVIFIEKNYADDFNLNKIADRFYLNPSYLSRAFKSFTGEKFSDFLTRKRIERAQKLLKETKSKVAEVAEVVGYLNTKYFIIKFKEATGMSPSDYRKKHNGAK
jgi:two-component system response regulator YesN